MWKLIASFKVLIIKQTLRKLEHKELIWAFQFKLSVWEHVHIYLRGGMHYTDPFKVIT